MPSAQEIYRNTVSGLPTEERLRLAALILKDLTSTNDEASEKLSIVEMINSLPTGRGFKNSNEVDEYLRGERDAWEH